MEIKNAIGALGALAHETRLGIFRVLVREGLEGLPAGDLAARLNVVPATLSFHLGHLERAGLLQSRRESRQIIYSIDQGGLKALLEFLVEDCCQGQASACETLLCELPVLCCGGPGKEEANETVARTRSG
ncbi:MAG TPA: transcriptional regulator [Rhodospirillaceae bacterium]|nr:transcriptional regulator [Rhodospirillaceae bacterium]HAA93089.1 transcriptional regulator [Rhodospirillaceae bacterium]HAT34593.1 transcriptional regulator [Rhodospirillaceae bacterium]|tara:strand:+ start:107 stop:496 length:390 start_codon:yes stop_codon:yes gene_type:complete